MGRPTRPLLSRRAIAEAALALVDQDGPEGASVRRIASSLNVHPTSLYNHVPSRGDIIEDVRGLISQNIDSLPLQEQPWKDGVLAWARSYRNAFAAHPRIIPLLMTSRASSPVTLSMYDAFVAAARKEGWDLSDILPLLTAMESFILGSVLDMTGPAVLFDPVGQEANIPDFAAAYATLGSQDPQDPVATRAFELGMQMLIAGASAMRDG
jgi:AcrR family transcriptional regulator